MPHRLHQRRCITAAAQRNSRTWSNSSFSEGDCSALAAMTALQMQPRGAQLDASTQLQLLTTHTQLHSVVSPRSSQLSLFLAWDRCNRLESSRGNFRLEAMLLTSLHDAPCTAFLLVKVLVCVAHCCSNQGYYGRRSQVESRLHSNV